jgi:hypothetical protein
MSRHERSDDGKRIVLRIIVHEYYFPVGNRLTEDNCYASIIKSAALYAEIMTDK